MNFKATALSIKDIRQIVKLIRKKCGLENCHNIPVCELFEWVLNKLFDEVEWEIVPKSKMAEEGITFTGDSIHKTVSFTTKHHLKNDVN